MGQEPQDERQQKACNQGTLVAFDKTSFFETKSGGSKKPATRAL